MRRLVAVQYGLLLPVDGLDERPDVRGVLAAHDRVGQRLVVVNRVELAFEILFQQVRVVDVFDGALEDHGLFFGEMHELRDVAEVRRFLVEADAVARLFDDETRLAEGHLEPFGQLVDVVGGVRREQLHQPQQALKFGLVHVLRIQ